jgi:hypothetical protein
MAWLEKMKANFNTYYDGLEASLKNIEEAKKHL